GDRDDGLFALLARFDPDLPARAGVLHRIHQDVRDTLNEASWVGVHEQRRIIRRDRQTVSLLADQRLHALDRLGYGCLEWQALQPEIDAPLADTRDVEQVVDEPREMRHLSPNDRDGGPSVLILCQR